MTGGPSYRATAPVRLDFAGGWTDVAPFCTRESGVVVNAAIDLRAEVLVAPFPEGFLLQSDDMGMTLTLGDKSELAADGKLDLLKAALRRSGLPAASLRTRSDAPAGSGLGSSGALDVALIAALDAVSGRERTRAELAEEAFLLEAVEASLPGGRQDQYAAALGGFHRLSFTETGVGIDPLELEPAFADELAAHLIICYTGVSRVSSRTIERVVDAYLASDPGVVSSLRAMKALAGEMADALVDGSLERVGRLLGEHWLMQQRLDPGMCTPEMATLGRCMANAGAIGGKAAGAGAGGAMFFLVNDPARAADAARQAGARVIPFNWSAEGVRVERIA